MKQSSLNTDDKPSVIKDLLKEEHLHNSHSLLNLINTLMPELVIKRLIVFRLKSNIR